MTGRWWEGGVVYQVYVRSWLDDDGDGFGDLAGVRRKLGYLSWLGVDGLWLSPTMPSPDRDWGYDVSDYDGVHRELGTLEDLDLLVTEASAHGLAVLLDLVPNHTSTSHPWYVEARRSRDAAHRDWYVWADPEPGGGPPNNWLDATGASAWTLSEPTGQYYLHSFLPSQADLNWRSPAVREEFEGILRRWFDRGISGVRIDVAHGLYHDRELRDDPPTVVGTGARFGLDRVHSMNQPEVHQLYREWRKLAEEYEPPRLLLGETWVLDAERLAAFYGDDDELQLGFNFPFVFSKLEATSLATIVRSTLAALPDGSCPVWMASNHDVSRFPTRWAGDDPLRSRLALTILCTLPGTTVLYYGDELGLPDVPVPVDAQRDEMTRGSDRFNRDRARTPMPWTTGPEHGFCPEGTTPWLPVGRRRGLTVQEEETDPTSTLSLTRRLLEVRRSAGAYTADAYEQLLAEGAVWAYRSGTLVVAANLGSRHETVELPAGIGGVVVSSFPDGIVGDRAAADARVRRLELGPWEAVVMMDANEGMPGG